MDGQGARWSLDARYVPCSPHLQINNDATGAQAAVQVLGASRAGNASSGALLYTSGGLIRFIGTKLQPENNASLALLQSLGFNVSATGPSGRRSLLQTSLSYADSDGSSEVGGAGCAGTTITPSTPLTCASYAVLYCSKTFAFMMNVTSPTRDFDDCCDVSTDLLCEYTMCMPSYCKDIWT